MKTKMTVEKVNKEYDAGLSFNRGINLYETVKTNEDFFIGKQWEGVQSNGLPTPVFNFLKRVVLFSVGNVATENIKLNAKPLPSVGRIPTRVLETFVHIINDQFAAIYEYNQMGGKVREFTRNAAVDGDGFLYSYWDSEVETGQHSRGAIKKEILLNTQVLFGNPNNRDVQSQPYIIIERRMLVKDAKRYAKKNGANEETISRIVPDNKESGNVELDQLGGEKVTVLLRMWKDEESGEVWCFETTRDAVLREPWSLGIELYPIVYMSWDYVQDCYHGQAMITGLIPNQIFVNKLFALSMISLMTLAYPKVIYDKTKISKWSAKVGAAIGVNGNVDGVAKIIDPAAISPQIAQFIDATISYTQKFLGASDVALGDTRPDNTSAIIALQRAAATPIELTKKDLNTALVLDGDINKAFMAEYYGKRYVEVDNPDKNIGGKLLIEFDFSILKKVPMSIDIDAGASAYWSEIANLQTLDNLLMQGRISTSEYLRRVPNGHISDREKLIEIAEAQERGSAVTPAMLTGISGKLDAEQGENLRGGAGYGALQRKINETGEIPRKVG